MRSGILICLSVLLWAVLVCTAASDLVYRNPRVFSVTYSFELAPDPAKIDRAKDLKLWLPIPREWDIQKAVKIISVEPPPHAEYEDPEHGNPTLFWDFGKEPEQASYKVEIKFRLETHEFHAEVDPEQVGAYDKTSDEYALYTRSSHTIRINPKIRELAQEAVGDEKNPYLQAERIAKFVRKKMRYKILDYKVGRGIRCLLDYPFKDEKTGKEYYEGSCNQEYALFIALCRAVGIPARSAYGFADCRTWMTEEDLSKPLKRFETNLSPTGTAGAQHYGHMQPHAWAEFYLPNYGWFPVDRYYSDFGHLSNKRVIFSKGRDVKVGPHCPEEDSEGYGSQWVLLNDGRADMMFSGVWNIARIQTARAKILLAGPAPFPAEAFLEYAEKLYPKDDEERKLKNWWAQLLGRIDWRTRGRQDRDVGLAEVYKRGGQIERDAFVCHMLRKIVGDDKFFQIFREYEALRRSSGEAVSKARFQEIAVDIYGEPLDWFFNQWLNTTQLPQLKLAEVTLDRHEKEWQIRGCLTQTDSAFFRMPIELTLDTEEGTEMHRIWQESRDTEFELRTSNKPIKLEVDADNDILKIQKTPPRLVWFWDAYDKMIIIYGTMAEADANKAAAERFDDEYLGLGHEIIKADTAATEEDLKSDCVVLFGRPATNKIAQQFRDVFPIEFDESKFIWQGAIYDQPTQGVALVVDHPLNSKGLLILYAGLSGEATLQVCDSYLYDAEASYVIFDGEETLVSGNWEEADGNLVWNFEIDEADGRD